VNLYSNQKSNSKGDVSAKISPEQKISSKILSNINFNEKCPIDNLTFTNNAINARNIELFSPSKIQNKVKSYFLYLKFIIRKKIIKMNSIKIAQTKKIHQ